MRNEVKALGLEDTPDNCWQFFIDRASGSSARCRWGAAHRALKLTLCAPALELAQVRRNLHVVLCFSPVGDKFRVRARQFPALVNCTNFDW